VNRVLKDLLWVGAVIVVPGLGMYLLAKKIWQASDEQEEFKKYVRKTYGKMSNYVERT
jgi:hypothetical protein